MTPIILKISFVERKRPAHFLARVPSGILQQKMKPLVSLLEWRETHFLAPLLQLSGPFPTSEEYIYYVYMRGRLVLNKQVVLRSLPEATRC
jgi:hypothetical protein